jgi:hypothetical protein
MDTLLVTCSFPQRSFKNLGLLRDRFFCFLLFAVPIHFNILLCCSSLHSCYRLCQSHPHSLHNSNYSWRIVQVIKLILQVPLTSCHFIPLGPNLCWIRETVILLAQFLVCSNSQTTFQLPVHGSYTFLKKKKSPPTQLM